MYCACPRFCRENDSHKEYHWKLEYIDTMHIYSVIAYCACPNFGGKKCLFLFCYEYVCIQKRQTKCKQTKKIPFVNEI